MTTKTIKVDVLSRVEGEGALLVRFKGNKPVEVKLTIYEPPRFFEGLLRGRSQMEVPDITARICGICPVAYQMSACHAIGLNNEFFIVWLIFTLVIIQPGRDKPPLLPLRNSNQSSSGVRPNTF